MLAWVLLMLYLSRHHMWVIALQIGALNELQIGLLRSLLCPQVIFRIVGAPGKEFNIGC